MKEVPLIVKVALGAAIGIMVISGIVQLMRVVGG